MLTDSKIFYFSGQLTVIGLIFNNLITQFE